MATEGLPKKPIIIGLVAVVLLILLGIGIWCLSLVDMFGAVTHEEEYMDKCKDYRLDESCADFKPTSTLKYCACLLEFTLKEDLVGDVTLYYELVDFDQTNSTYARSRDDNQLRGNLDSGPAASCGNYSYVGDKPIFPCGEVADSMFNDTFYLKQANGETVNVLYTKLFASDTPAFKNPPADKLKNYISPIHWRNDGEENPWEYLRKPKGVENLAFQAWMDTSLKRKPAWRIEPKGNFTNGLPAGDYTFDITINYGVDRYRGVRKLILEGVTKSQGARSLAWGVILLLVSLGGLLLGALYIFYIKLQNDRCDMENDAATRPSDDKEVPLLHRLRDRIRNIRS